MTPPFSTRWYISTLTLLTLLVSSISVSANDLYRPKNIYAAGLGAAMDSGEYEGQDADVNVTPLANVYHDGFFIRGASIGHEFINYRKVAASVSVRYNSNQLDISDINSSERELYAGIDDRDPSVEVGVTGYYYSPVGRIEGSIFRDVTNTHDGLLAELKISRLIDATGNFIIAPGLFINYYSDKYNLYYYGVSEQENIDGADLTSRPIADFENFRPQYTPGNSGHLGVELLLGYRFSETLSFTSLLTVEDLTGEVETSPLIEDKSNYSYVAGLLYHF